MALGGVEEGGVDDAVGHGAYADVGGGVDADDANVAASLGARGLRRSDGHAVVVGIDELRVGIEVQERVGRARGFFFLPVGRRAGKDCAALCLQLGGKAFVAVLGGGGTWQSVYLYDLAARPYEMLRVARCGASQPHVVHADAGGVGVAVDVAVEDDDGRASLVDFFDDGREGSGRLWKRCYRGTLHLVRRKPVSKHGIQHRRRHNVPALPRQPDIDFGKRSPRP